MCLSFHLPFVVISIIIRERLQATSNAGSLSFFAYVGYYLFAQSGVKWKVAE